MEKWIDRPTHGPIDRPGDDEIDGCGCACKACMIRAEMLFGSVWVTGVCVVAIDKSPGWHSTLDSNRTLKH